MLKFLNSVHLNHLFMHLTNGLASLLSYTTLQYYIGRREWVHTSRCLPLAYKDMLLPQVYRASLTPRRRAPMLIQRAQRGPGACLRARFREAAAWPPALAPSPRRARYIPFTIRTITIGYFFPQ